MDALHDFMQRHENVVLQFSAGKDSAACLKLLRPYLSKVIVLWVNPGSPYPETVEYMANVARKVPRFTPLVGRQPAFIARWGHPADIVPFEATRMGRIATGNTGPMLTSVEHCCGQNLWAPMQQAIKDLRVTGAIRGEKACDSMRSSMKQGEVFDGVEYHFPVLDWSDEQVLAFVGDELPESYGRGLPSSLDCINCTAYVNHNPGRLADLRERHPDAWQEVQPVLSWLRDAMRKHQRDLETEL